MAQACKHFGGAEAVCEGGGTVVYDIQIEKSSSPQIVLQTQLLTSLDTGNIEIGSLNDFKLVQGVTQSSRLRHLALAVLS